MIVVGIILVLLFILVMNWMMDGLQLIEDGGVLLFWIDIYFCSLIGFVVMGVLFVIMDYYMLMCFVLVKFMVKVFEIGHVTNII